MIRFIRSGEQLLVRRCVARCTRRWRRRSLLAAACYQVSFFVVLTKIQNMLCLFVIGGVVTVLIISIPVLLALYTLLLAAVTHWRQRSKDASSFRTSLYVGRVSHTRLVPVVHSFNYPLFMCAVDLDETEQLWGTKGSLWPLSTVMSFRPKDHYKSGEGGGSNPDLTLTERTFNLIQERTKGAFCPTQQTHRIVLVTHLCYYGYCFNPVSFYYVLQTESISKIDAIVLEVSNTPWNEMKCYVLHPSSVDVERVQPGKTRKRNDGSEIHSTNYTFKKTFHVSPFMDMQHLYDWTFWEFPLAHDVIFLHASMVKGDVRQFTATVDMAPTPFTPFALAWQLIQFPIYCAIIQVWIHMEAFWLFKKGVTYQPHPEGSETTASRLIGKVMTPLFALKDKIQSYQCRDKEE